MGIAETDTAQSIADQDAIRSRLHAVLSKLREGGIRQQDISECVRITPQYLSDVKTGRKPVTHLFALRLGNCYGFDPGWLTKGGDTPDFLSQPKADKSSPSSLHLMVELPVFHRPIVGDPNSHPDWDGTMVAISGAAAVSTETAKAPYILRFRGQDPQKELRRTDLLLIAQEVKNKAQIQLVRCRREICLARKTDNKRWQRADNAKICASDVEALGCCVGIVWRPL